MSWSLLNINQSELNARQPASLAEEEYFLGDSSDESRILVTKLTWHRLPDCRLKIQGPAEKRINRDCV